MKVDQTANRTIRIFEKMPTDCSWRNGILYGFIHYFNIAESHQLWSDIGSHLWAACFLITMISLRNVVFPKLSIVGYPPATFREIGRQTKQPSRWGEFYPCMIVPECNAGTWMTVWPYTTRTISIFLCRLWPYPLEDSMLLLHGKSDINCSISEWLDYSSDDYNLSAIRQHSQRLKAAIHGTFIRKQRYERATEEYFVGFILDLCIPETREPSIFVCHRHWFCLDHQHRLLILSTTDFLSVRQTPCSSIVDTGLLFHVISQPFRD